MYQWNTKNNLLANCIINCTHCNVPMRLSKRQERPQFNTSFRCSKNRNHESSICRFSFFEGSKIEPRDLLFFIRCYIKGDQLHICAKEPGLAYGSTAVDWASYVRDIFIEK